MATAEVPAPESVDEPADPSSKEPGSDAQGTADDWSASADKTPHPLGPIGTSLDDAVDRVWDRLRGNPAMDRLFYTASELGDFSLIWHLLGTARASRPGTAPGRRPAWRWRWAPNRHWSTVW